MAARLGILGDGGWGTALALHLTRRQDLLDLELPEPDLSIYQRDDGGAA